MWPSETGRTVMPPIVRQNSIPSVYCGLAAKFLCHESQERPKFSLVDCTEAKAQPKDYGGVGDVKSPGIESGDLKPTAIYISGFILHLLTKAMKDWQQTL